MNNIQRRGRPKSIETLVTEKMAQQRKFTREYTHRDGVKDIWTYDLDKNLSGPVSVEMVYPKGYNHSIDYTQKENHWIPVSQRLYIHPKTGKEISHKQAVKIGLAR
jgi:hypothetical protein